MKTLNLFFIFITLTVSTVFGQIKIGENPQNIDAASVLELESSSKVLVITRVTTQEMETITPQRGGLAYNTDTECIHYYDGTRWVNLCDAVDFTITNDPIINNRSTIEITQSENGYNLEIAKNSILGDNIVDGGIGPNDIQDNSITQDKLAAESVGSSEIRQNAVGSDEIRDGSLIPSDVANYIPGHVFTTDENGIVQWEAADDLYDLTFSKLDTTLSITRSTIPGTSTVNLGALIGSDDQQLTLADNILTLEEGGTPIDLSTYVSSDDQNLGSATLLNEQLTINIENGNSTTANLSALATDAALASGLALKENVANKSNNTALGTSAILYPTQNAVKVYVDTEIADVIATGGSDPINEQNQAFNVVADQLRITDIGGTLSVPLSAIDTNTQLSDADIAAFGYIKTDSDNQDLSRTGNTINISGGTGVDLTPILGSGADGVITDVELQGNNLVFTGTAPGFNGPVSLAGLAGEDGITTLTNGTILVGFTGNVPTERSVAGDVTMNNLGEVTINNGVITPANIEPLEPTPAQNNMLITDTTGNVTWAPITAGGTTQEADGITITGIGTNADPFKIEPGANGQFLSTAAGAVTWDNLPAGTGGTVIGDNTTIEGNGSVATPLQIVDGGVTSTQIADGTISTIDIADNNITPAKITGGIDGQVLTTTATGVAWQNAVGPVIVSANDDNSITEGTDGGAYYDDTALTAITTANAAAILLKEDSANKSTDGTLADNSDDDFPTEQAVKTYVDTQISGLTIGENLANANLEQTENIRTYEVGTDESLVFTGLGNVGFGNGANPPLSKFHFAGEIRVEGVNSADGTVGSPAYTFSGDTNNDTGMYRPAADEIGFSVGGFEALRIDEPTAGNTNVIINQSLQLNNLLLDKDGQSGTAGQILSSTGGQTDWIDITTSTADWSTITNIPPDFADDIDNDTQYTAGAGLTLTGTTFAFDGSSITPDWTTLINVPAGFADDIDNDTQYTAGAGLTLTGTTFAFDGSSITPDWTTLINVPAGFADDIDNDTQYTAGAGLTLTGTTFAFDGSSITPDWTTLINVPAGFADDIDNDTQYTAGAGLTLTGTTFAFDGSSITPDWTTLINVPAGFADDIDNDTQYTAGAGLTLTGTTFAFDGSSITPDWTTLINVPAGFADDIDNDTQYTAGAGLTLTGTTFAFDGSSITPDWTTLINVPAGFADDIDNDTQYTAGAGLTLTGTTFAFDGSSITPDWTTLINVPAGFADDIDNDTQYTAGAGLTLTGTTFAFDGSSITPDWTTLINVPAGFADDIDNDTQYTAGAGLTLTGTTFAFDGSSITPDWTTLINVPAGFADDIDNDTQYTGSDGIDVTGTVISLDAGSIPAGSIPANLIETNPTFTGNVSTNGSFISGTATYPDYVFEKYFLGKSALNTSYEFSSLETIEAYLKKHHHLPGVTSVDEIKANNGNWNLTEGALVNLEKIEELFLHTIEQEKKIKELEAANNNIATEMASLKAQLQEIKALLQAKSNKE